MPLKLLRARGPFLHTAKHPEDFSKGFCKGCLSPNCPHQLRSSNGFLMWWFFNFGILDHFSDTAVHCILLIAVSYWLLTRENKTISVSSLRWAILEHPSSLLHFDWDHIVNITSRSFKSGQASLLSARGSGRQDKIFTYKFDICYIFQKTCNHLVSIPHLRSLTSYFYLKWP